VVNVDDLLDVIAAFGQTDGSGDTNGDGVCDVNDVLEVINAWGPCG
jgi:hypothetical protein